MPDYFRQIDEDMVKHSHSNSEDVNNWIRTSLRSIWEALPIVAKGGWYWNGGQQWDLRVQGNFTQPNEGVILRLNNLWFPDGVEKVRVHVYGGVSGAGHYMYHRYHLINLDTNTVFATPNIFFTSPYGVIYFSFDMAITEEGAPFRLDMYGGHAAPGIGWAYAYLYHILIRPLWE